MTLNGSEKSALLLMSIGTDQAAEILKHLTPFEVHKLITSMVNINQFSTETLTLVLRECYDLTKKFDTISCNNSDDYLTEMLTKALGEEEGNNLLKDILDTRHTETSIQSLNFINPETIASLLDDEHPQIIAIILIHLNQIHSSQILSFFKNEKRSEIILKIIKFNGIEESRLVELTKVINNLLKKKKFIFLKKGGLKTAVKILNSMNVEHEKEIIDNISLFNKELSESIIKEICLFKNIVNLNDNSIKSIIKNIEKEKLCIALYNSNQKIKNKFLKNMSKTEADLLRLNLEKKSYVSDIAIKNEQKLIFIIIKNILKNGYFSLKKLRDNNV